MPTVSALAVVCCSRLCQKTVEEGYILVASNMVDRDVCCMAAGDTYVI
jgi:hypothetical protein